MARPPALADVTVLDFSTVGPAARCSRILADFGACVIKIGAPSKKGSVQIEPPHYGYSAHRGMRRIRIDLKTREGKAAFLRLAASADVVIESFRPGVVDRLGIGYEDVREGNEGIIYCSTSGFGQDGPRAHWAGHDLNYLAAAGFLHCSGRGVDGRPPLPGATVADSAGGGMHAVIAILAALLRRSTTGRGEYLDVSVAEGVLSLMSLSVDQHLATGEEPGPGHDILTGRYACYDVYRARDGKWLAVGAIEPVFFANLCKALDLERWIPHQLEDTRQDEIRTDLCEAFARRDRDEWVAELGPANTCVSPVSTIRELASDPQFLERGVFAEARHPRRGRFRQLGPVLAGMERAREPYPVRDAGETDPAGALRAAGLPEGEIERFVSEGVVG